MLKRRAAHNKANHERWLLSYADLLTLLFALFVVLYASAKLDNKRLAQMSAAIHSGFQELSASGGSPKQPAGANITDVDPETLPPQPSLVDLEKKLNQVLSDELVRNDVQVRTTPDGIVVSLREIGFFPNGEAGVLPQAHRSLAKIAQAAAQHKVEIGIEGHTDSRPIHRRQFPSNWELSAARATSVASILIDEGGFDPARISVAGFAGYRPVGSNDTEEGRALNRRVDLLIQKMK